MAIQSFARDGGAVLMTCGGRVREGTAVGDIASPVVRAPAGTECEHHLEFCGK